jgi:hypothetical protein
MCIGERRGVKTLTLFVLVKNFAENDNATYVGRPTYIPSNKKELNSTPPTLKTKTKKNAIIFIWSGLCT